jgi:hypothetical protein
MHKRTPKNILPLKKLKSAAWWLPRSIAGYWHKNWWHKVICAVVTVALISLGFMYGVAQWYIWSERDQPLELGVSFVADYAESLGLNPHQTFSAILDDLHVKNVRLVSYWNDIEPQPGAYNFSELDWEFQQAETHGAKVSLSIGLRQPRWPECHEPTWARSEPTGVWEPQLLQFMTTVVDRYKNNPALSSYQLENEYFLQAFGSCTNYSRQRLITEADLVRRLDPKHTLIISRSQNALGWPISKPAGDEYAISIYRRVWTPVLGRYIEYPFPAWYYAFLAGMEKIWSGKDTIIHELQAEPWAPNQKTLPQISLAEQNKSFNANTLKTTVAFGKATGMKTIYLWGAEYWYYRMTVLHDPSVWNTARTIIKTN